MEEEKVSIIMSVYNEEDTVGEAVKSIINQTYSNWEFIICDDASTDDTNKILLKYKNMYPDKFILLKNSENKKLSYSLNRCLAVATGKYVARMDADDLSTPSRIEKQVNFLKKNLDIDLVGTAMQRFDQASLADIDYPPVFPSKYTLKKEIPFNHATIMTYKYVYDILNGYTVSLRTVRGQDVDLWFRFYDKGFTGSNMLIPLYLVRENKDAIKRRTIKVRFNGYKTMIKGYRLLQYPIHWYIRPTLLFIIKSIIPTKLMMMYRDYQIKKFKKS